MFEPLIDFGTTGTKPDFSKYDDEYWNNYQESDNPLIGKAGMKGIYGMMGGMFDRLPTAQTPTATTKAPTPTISSHRIQGNWTPQELLPDHLKASREGFNQALPDVAGFKDFLPSGTPVDNPSPITGEDGRFIDMPHIMPINEGGLTPMPFKGYPDPVTYPKYGGGQSPYQNPFTPEGLENFQGNFSDMVRYGATKGEDVLGGIMGTMYGNMGVGPGARQSGMFGGGNNFFR